MLIKLTNDEAWPVLGALRHVTCRQQPIPDGSSTGQLDFDKFWFAWERGSEVTSDVFADAWDLWAVAAERFDDLRDTYHVPPLDPAHAADGHVPSW